MDFDLIVLQASLGVADINRPDYGDAVDLEDGDIPVFWACGVTPQAVVMKSKYVINTLLLFHPCS